MTSRRKKRWRSFCIFFWSIINPSKTASGRGGQPGT
jgi:hypothetical protein